ncbi:hypothetical protein L902_00085 [Agrobacterium radiobacter DSM 30147]|nr:hypothetical protein L902_00085 [Agrobacterium radiobacter DSM 30147]
MGRLLPVVLAKVFSSVGVPIGSDFRDGAERHTE